MKIIEYGLKEKEYNLKILWTSDSPHVDTGFGRVAKSIISRLKHTHGHDVVVLGVNHYGDPYDPEEFDYPIYPCDKGHPDAIFGIHKLWNIAAKYQPDVLFILNDPWVTAKYLAARPPGLLPNLKIVTYFPLDAGPLKKGWAETLSKLDAQICYSKFAERIIIEANNGKRPKNLHQIYHGVDTKVFFPVNQSQARQATGIPADAFVVGMVARNQYRKRFDILVRAFAKFAKDKPEAKLYLHTALDDVGFDIKDLVAQYDIADQLILTEDVTPAKGVPDSFLNLIYNTFDVNCLISLGDGFGLPVAESMAVGVPQVVSDHSCLSELVAGHGGLTVETKAWIMHVSGINTFGGFSDEDDLVKKLEMLYNSKDLRLKLATDGYNFITSPQFNWDVIAEQMNNIIKDLFHIYRVKEGGKKDVNITNKELVGVSAS